MKKNISKNTKKTQKTKIQVKIKSNNVTNNFILTPRTHSAIDKKDILTKIDKFTEEIQSERDRDNYQEPTYGKTCRDNRINDYRNNTDQPKFINKKCFLEETGTHTPFLKRISYTSDSGNKRKSSFSQANLKLKKKSKSKLINSQSAQFDKSTMQRLIGVIVRDYKQGRLKEKELEQTLMELYDRKERKKSVSKKTKKKVSRYTTFSNDMIKEFHTKSQALTRKQKKGQQIYEGVLEREGFVNKIIIKGITTSLFLKEQVQFSNVKEKKPHKNLFYTPDVNLNTSHSVLQLNEDIKRIRQIIQNEKIEYQAQNIYERMAIKIQKAWRGYQTRKILKGIFETRGDRSPKAMNAFHIVDEFTDEQNDQAYTNTKFTRNIVPQEGFGQTQKYSQIVNLISNNLNQKNLSKEECLNNILKFLNISVTEKHKNEEKISSKEEKKEKKEDKVYKEISLSLIQMASQGNRSNDDEQSHSESLKMLRSRVKIFQEEAKVQRHSKQAQNFEEAYSNELKSFTNKYSSKDAIQNREQYQLQPINTEQFDQSLTFGHSQTSAYQSFKIINIQNIQEGLRGKQENLIYKKQKQIEILTERLFGNKINKDQYQKEKEKIDKLFKKNQKQLRKIRNALLKSCFQAKKILENDVSYLNSGKSQKMLKCLSDKYIKKNDWSLKIKAQKKKQRPSQSKNQKYSLSSSENQQKQFQYATKTQKNENQVQKNIQFFIFHNNDIAKQQDEQQKTLGFNISPKLSRHERQELNDFKFEQIQKIIDSDDDLQDGLYQIQNKKMQSDKFPQNKLINETAKKFKYLCNEDKEDIFQFLFLDLVLEMFTEPYSGQARILKSAEIHINKLKRLKKIPKGIKTNINYCKDYLKILQENIILDNRLTILSYPMGPTAFQMLRYMRDEIVQDQQEESLSTTVVLPIKFFQSIAKTKVPEMQVEAFYDDVEKQQHRIMFLKNINHILNKALFDALNEMLDHERPYGIWGKPFPWKKVISIDRKWSKEQELLKLKKSMEKTIESCSYLCGILVDKEDSLFGVHRVSQEFLSHLREDRLSKMLANDLLENEERWIFYDDETTEILIEVNNYLINKLIKECVLEVVGLSIRY